MTRIDDIPIEHTREDRFTFTPFANSIAEAIYNLNDPKGSVVAITGPWGCGKSSAINLIRNRLAKDAKDITVVPLECLNYHNQDALAADVIVKLFLALKQSLGQRETAEKLRKWFVRHSKEIGLARDAVAATLEALAPGIGPTILGIVLKFLRITDSDSDKLENVDELRGAIRADLSKANKRILVVVDDLDRLAPDEIVPLIKVIKTIGQLPGVIYLLAFDEKIVADAIQHFYTRGSTAFEGRRFLEKVVQARFDMPRIGAQALQAMLLDYASKAIDVDLMDTNADATKWIGRALLKEFRTPRDVVRYANALGVTYGPVKDNVHIPDFLKMEAIRLFRPAVFEAVRVNSFELLGPHIDSSAIGGDEDEIKARYDRLLLATEPKSEHDRLRGILMSLFPKLETIWYKIQTQDNDEATRLRRICSRRHFDTYFRFSISELAISERQIAEIFSELSGPDGGSRYLSNLLMSGSRDFGNAVLEELKVRAPGIPIARLPNVLEAVFAVADDLLPAYAGADGNEFDFRCIEALTESLVLARPSLDMRTKLILGAARRASLCWLVHLTAITVPSAARSQGSEPNDRSIEALISEDGVERLRAMALNSIRDRAKDKSFLELKLMRLVLLFWSGAGDDGLREARDFLRELIETDKGVVRAVRAFLVRAHPDSFVWIGRRPVPADPREGFVDMEQVERLFDRHQLLRRVGEVRESQHVSEDDLEAVEMFLYALNNSSQWLPGS